MTGKFDHAVNNIQTISAAVIILWMKEPYSKEMLESYIKR